MDNPQPKVSEIEYGWFAGFFDGEGSVILSIRAKAGKNESPKIQPNAKISGTDALSLEVIASIFERAEIGFHVVWFRPKGFMRNGKKYKMAWDITIAGHKRCRRFYRWITPILKTKKERAELMIDYLNARESHTDFRTPITENELRIALHMRVLNLKGKAKPYQTALKLNTERPGASHEQLSKNGRKGALARWGN